mgnify:CR=1 FL=1
MKLVFRGHDERYVVEQSLMNLFPGELPVYEPITPGDDSWAVISLEETGDLCRVAVSLCRGGKTTEQTYQEPLSSGDFQREGLRRHAVGACFFLAARAVTGVTPPWGMLTGVRPDKPVTWALEDGKSPEEARAYLEEHYFVTPSRAALALETGATAAKAARRLEKRDIDVYVGIPFCPTRCAYCSFVSQSVERSFALVPPYVDALCGEISAGGEMVRRAGLRVRTFYMGGGTPTTLSAPQLDRLMGELADHIDLSGCTEYTVEAGRPDTITAEKLAVLARRGCSRVSVNPQTMQDAVLERMGRAHRADDILRAYALARESGIGCINMDLIAGLPGDSAEGFRASLEQVLALGPENVTVHTLALKKGSRLMEEGGGLPSGAAVADMLDFAWAALRAAGQRPYYLYRQKYMSGSFENVGWCRPGAESLYNICMMEELHTIVSLGGGGVTKLVDRATGYIERLANAKYPQEYIQKIDAICADKARVAQFYAAHGR